MIRIFSKGCEYALRVLTKPELSEDTGRFSIKKICKKIKIPESYTRKIFQALVRKGILTAAQGPGGGYCLKKSPGDISVLSVIEAVDGKNALQNCVMGFKECSNGRPCAVHHLWGPVRAQIASELEIVTLEHLRNHPKKNPTNKKERPR